MQIVIGVWVGLVPLLPALMYALRRRSAKVTQRTILGFSAINVVIALAMLGLGAVWFLNPAGVQAAGLAQENTGRDPMAYIGAGVAVGLGSIGAGYAVGNVGAAAVGAVAERPELFGRVLLFVGLAEGVAIYGLIIAFIILG